MPNMFVTWGICNNNNNDPDWVSVRGERANFTRLVLGCIETTFCKQILVGISYLFEKKIEKREMGRD